MRQIVVADQALTVFTDGSAFSRPRRGGIGIHFVHCDALGQELTFDLEEPGFTAETVNRMELLAVITALRAIDKGRIPPEFLDGIRRIDIYSDSQYVVGNLNSALFSWPRARWMTREGAPVLNADLWKDLVREYSRIAQSYRVEIQWAKGHTTGNPGNKVADRLAKESASRPSAATRVPPSVRRKLSPLATEPGSVLMLGQRLTIRIIEAEYLPTQRIHRYRYEVVSRRSQFRRRVDFAYSDDPLMRPGHVYVVGMGRDQGYPKIVRCHREVSERPVRAETELRDD